MPAKYRISELRVEGFRGFTTPQTFDLEGKNVFIFGQNGRGKSSLVEAIRWCLFGAGGGSDIQVRNTHYEKQECSVSMLLKGEGGTLRLHREFRPGHGHESRVTISDARGKAVQLQDALPQLSRLGPHESTQIIFAAQHAAGQKLTDISDFGKVLCFYLQLEDVPELALRLGKLREERTAEAEDLAGEIEKLEHAYREQLREVQTRLETILADPPWNTDSTPTGNETTTKIEELVRSVANIFKEEFPSGKTAVGATANQRAVDRNPCKGRHCGDSGQTR